MKNERMIRRVINITTNEQQPSDRTYWLSRTVSDRINAVKLLRQPTLNKKDNVPQRLQRVYRITQQTPN